MKETKARLVLGLLSSPIVLAAFVLSWSSGWNKKERKENPFRSCATLRGAIDCFLFFFTTFQS